MPVFRSLLLMLLFVLASCDPHDSRLTIINNSNRNIFYLLSQTDSVHYSPLYIQGGDTIWDQSNIVPPVSLIQEAMMGSNGWEEYINDCEENRLRVFIFEEELLKNESWDSIYLNQKYSKLYRLTLDELQKNNWQVEYR